MSAGLGVAMKAKRTTTGKRRAGAVATEFALILPVLILIMLMCLDFGRFAYHHVAVTNAARAGAEYAIMHPYQTSTQSAWQTSIRTAARDELTNQTGCNPSNLSTSTTVVTESNGIRRVRVTTSYASFQTLVSWPGIPNSTTLTASVEMWMIR